MGLDQWFYSVDHGLNPSGRNVTRDEISSLGRYPNFMPFLQRVWLESQPEGADPRDFNCNATLQITPEIFHRMREHAFSTFSEDLFEFTNEILTDIQAALNNGSDVYYWASW